MSDDSETTISVAEWQDADTTAATPKCPYCGQHLGIRSELWTATGRAMWFCDDCGEFDRV